MFPLMNQIALIYNSNKNQIRFTLLPASLQLMTKIV